MEKIKDIVEQIKKDEKSEYLKTFHKKVLLQQWIMDEEFQNKIMPIGNKIIKELKSQELTYVESYEILEYVYRYLQFKSEYTHL